jgi:hypothetical protein
VVDPHIAQLETIRGELVDLRARVDADFAKRQFALDALMVAANVERATDAEAHAGFVRELDYITGLTEA